MFILFRLSEHFDHSDCGKLQKLILAYRIPRWAARTVHNPGIQSVRNFTDHQKPEIDFQNLLSKHEL